MARIPHIFKRSYERALQHLNGRTHPATLGKARGAVPLLTRRRHVGKSVSAKQHMHSRICPRGALGPQAPVSRRLLPLLPPPPSVRPWPIRRRDARCTQHGAAHEAPQAHPRLPVHSLISPGSICLPSIPSPQRPQQATEGTPKRPGRVGVDGLRSTPAPRRWCSIQAGASCTGTQTVRVMHASTRSAAIITAGE
jgi:hypothetical protein